MSDIDSGAEAGEQSFEQEFDAARDAQLPGDAAALEDGAEPEGQEPEAAEGEEAAKPPLTLEEIRKRLNDQQGATRQERQRRRALEQEVQELRARATAAPKTGETLPARPNPEEDPIGYLQYVEDMLQRSEAAAVEQGKQTEAEQAAQREVQKIVSAVEEHENDFRELTPDYNEAAEHLYGVKKAEYTEAGYTDAEAHTAVMNEFLTRSRRALDTGKNPAEIVYNLARKAGYASKAGEAKLDAIEKGQKRTSPLAGSGAGGRGELSVESVGNLKGAAFDSAFAKLRERAESQGW